MARLKPIFDTDILIHLVKTEFIDTVISLFGEIFIADYVYNEEIKKDTPEGKAIKKLINIGSISILEYTALTDRQRTAFLNAKRILEEHEEAGSVNIGEKITACFANAHNIPYYMSNDNKAAPVVRAVTGIEIIMYLDLLYLYLRKEGIEAFGVVKAEYGKYIALYDKGKEPRYLKENGEVIQCKYAMAISYEKFLHNDGLKRLLQNTLGNIK